MVNKALLLDRFGEIDFLHELWTKARKEIPGRLDSIEPVVQEFHQADSDDGLGKMLHKLRGLVSNFLTEKEALSAIISCEKSVQSNDPVGVTESWKQFRVHLDREVNELDQWLASEGFEKG